MAIKDGRPTTEGGPAFPAIYGDEQQFIYQGMSLRDFFAAHAYFPDEVVADAMDLPSHLPSSRDRIHGVRALAKWAYEYADAMLAQRERQ